MKINKDLVDTRDVHFAAEELPQMHDCHGCRTLQVPLVCHLHKTFSCCINAPTDGLLCSEIPLHYNKYLTIQVEGTEMMMMMMMKRLSVYS